MKPLKISKKCKQSLKDNRDRLRLKKNVIGTGVGRKISNGVKTDKECITVFVKAKTDRLSNKDRVPKTIDGVLTDVIEVGVIKPHHREKRRPVVGGTSCAHIDSTAGTIGGIFKFKNDEFDRKYILSNNHVLALSNNALLGDIILQPGPHDGGRFGDAAATLSSFVRIKFDGSPNYVDVALGEIIDPDIIRKVNAPEKQNVFVAIFRAIINFFKSLFSHVPHPTPPEPPKDPELGENELEFDMFGIGPILPRADTNPKVGHPLVKSGRTTSITNDEIIAMDVDIDVDYYPEGGIARFTDQILAGNMSQGGDSGSLVLNRDTSKIVGLLFAGSDTVTVINPIQRVMEAIPGLDIR